MFKNLLIAILYCGAAARIADAQSLTLFTDTATVFNHTSSFNQVSDDGRTIVFGNDTMWTAANGLQLVSSVTGENREATAISRDGKTIAGALASDFGGAWRWSQQDGFQDLGFLPVPNRINDARTVRAVSANGSVVVGGAIGADLNIGLEAFRWTVQTGMVSIGSGTAIATSDDGSVIVGGTNTSFGPAPSVPKYPFRWTQQTGAVNLPLIPGFIPGHLGEIGCQAVDVSADGNVVVGWMQGLGNAHIFRWTAATGSVDIEVTVGLNLAVSCSADGNTLVGTALRENVGESAFIWDQVHGTRWLDDVATSRGIDLQGFHMVYASDISGDGRFIVGGSDLDTPSPPPAKYFRLDLGPVPEPAGCVLAAMAVATIGPLRRRGRRGVGTMPATTVAVPAPRQTPAPQ